jgi:hypothetical protein
MRFVFVLLLAACADNSISANGDLAKSYPKEGMVCGGGDLGPVDPNACGSDYLCMQISDYAVCLVLSGPGDRCGGFTNTPRLCQHGLTCKSPPIPDAPGTCQ